MAPSSILVLGSVNVDLVIRGPRHPVPGETVLGGDFYQANGGKGANQAVAAARLNHAPVTLIASVGDDRYGNATRAELATENLVCDHLKIVADVPTGIALILVDAQGENMISVASGANHRLTPFDIDALPSEIFDAAKVLLVSLEVPLDTVGRGLQRAKRAGLLTILNPAPADPRILHHEMLSLVDVLTPNTGEAQALAGKCATVEDAARQLNNLGARSVIVTLGAAGCLVVDQGVSHIPAVEVEAVDTTAAGDAFNGALAVALAEGVSLTNATRWANGAAALSVTRPGAQPSLPRRNEVDSLLAGDAG